MLYKLADFFIWDFIWEKSIEKSGVDINTKHVNISSVLSEVKELHTRKVSYGVEKHVEGNIKSLHEGLENVNKIIKNEKVKQCVNDYILKEKDQEIKLQNEIIKSQVASVDKQIKTIKWLSERTDVNHPNYRKWDREEFNKVNTDNNIGQHDWSLDQHGLNL